MRGKLLRTVLFGRVIASVGFVAWLNVSEASASGLVPPLRAFAIADGVLSLVMAAVGVGIPTLRRWFVLVTTLDGLWLIAAGAVWFGVHTPDFVLTMVLYVALGAVCVLSVGLLHLAERRRERGGVGGAMRAGLSIAAIASALFGVGAYFMRPNPGAVRWLLIAAAVVEALALLAVAVRKMPDREAAPHIGPLSNRARLL